MNIVEGRTYRCVDRNGNERTRLVEKVDSNPYMPEGDRKVYFTNIPQLTMGSLYVREFVSQAREAVK